MNSYVFGKPVALPFPRAVERITEELAKQGFGVLTDIDVQATMKKKLDLDMPAYRILGACNPGLASQALAADPQIGALLPCNVVVREDAAGAVHVEAMDPASVLQLADHPAVPALAADVRRRLQLALDGLAA